MDARRDAIDRLVAGLRGVCAQSRDETELLARVMPLAQRAALAGAEWLEECMFEIEPEQGFGVHVLHEEPGHGLTVWAVGWLPHRGAPPHNHGTWAVVAGVVGRERNDFFQRMDDRSRPGHAELRRIGSESCAVGDVVVMPDGMIHSVANVNGSVSLSLHIYGRHPNFTGRSQFDPEQRTETPFVVSTRSA